jgi:hypothetical protein
MEDGTKRHPQKIQIKSAEVFEAATRDIKSYPGFMRDECKVLL